MLILAYFTPDVVLPMASVFAAALGFLMMVGRAPFRLAARGFRAVRRVWRKDRAPGPGPVVEE